MYVVKSAHGRPRPPRRRGPKQRLIDDYLRRAIASGRLRPGERLPTRSEIERRFRASPTTVQKALQRLIDDGFVVPAGRRGTFVSSGPPHLSHYVLAFPHRPGEPGWVRFWTALTLAASRWAAESGRRISIYTGVDPCRDDGDLARLSEDVEARRLAGIIFGADPWPLAGHSILRAAWLPRVAFVGPAGRPGVAGVNLGGDGGPFFEKALDLLASRRRHRVALITVPGISGEKLDVFRKQLSERGMVSRPWWVQTAHQSEPRWAAHLTLLMFRAPTDERPDGLIVADDNLAEHACAGVVQAGVRVGDELDIVAHCNFPAPAPSVLPTRRLGYDIDRAFATCIDLLERKRRGERVPAVTDLGPVFEEEATGAGGLAAGSS